MKFSVLFTPLLCALSLLFSCNDDRDNTPPGSAKSISPSQNSAGESLIIYSQPRHKETSLEITLNKGESAYKLPPEEGKIPDISSMRFSNKDIIEMRRKYDLPEKVGRWETGAIVISKAGTLELSGTFLWKGRKESRLPLLFNHIQIDRESMDSPRIQPIHLNKGSYEAQGDSCLWNSIFKETIEVEASDTLFIVKNGDKNINYPKFGNAGQTLKDLIIRFKEAKRR